MSLELSKKAAAVKPSSTLAITAKAKELRAQGKDVVGFGAGDLISTHLRIFVMQQLQQSMMVLQNIHRLQESTN